MTTIPLNSTKVGRHTFSSYRQNVACQAIFAHMQFKDTTKTEAAVVSDSESEEEEITSNEDQVQYTRLGPPIDMLIDCTRYL